VHLPLALIGCKFGYNNFPKLNVINLCCLGRQTGVAFKDRRKERIRHGHRSVAAGICLTPYHENLIPKLIQTFDGSRRAMSKRNSDWYIPPDWACSS